MSDRNNEPRERWTKIGIVVNVIRIILDIARLGH
jgi:hypothetical protein